MAEIVGFIALSHSPFWDMSLALRGPGAEFVAGVRKAREQLAALEPDALVIFGPDHFRNFFYDVMPPFCIGVEQVTSFGDYNMPKGEVPVAGDLARDIFSGVSQADFDPAVSLSMGIDHGISQPYAVLDGAHTPMVPIMVNGGGAPRPGLRRCFAFGQAVGAAIRASDKARRVAILASGGLSHWVRPVSADSPAITPETLRHVIHGRATVRAYSASRDADVAARREEGAVGKVNPVWDRWFLDALAGGDLEPVFAQTADRMEEEAGNGSHEIRAWLAAAGAWARPIRVLSYEPVPTWVTGMGCVIGY